MMPERKPIESLVWLNVKCSALAGATLEKLIGPPTVVVENGGGAGADPEATSRLLYYKLKTPPQSKEERAKLELVRELAAKIVNNEPVDISPEQLSPSIYRIVTQNLD